jgi:ribosomal protein S18 acetylase RimI-like enzyme
MPPDPLVIPLPPDRSAFAAAVLARAFDRDPFFVYVLPDPVRRGRLLPWLFERTVRYGLRCGKVFTTPDLDGLAVCLWQKGAALDLWGSLRTGLAGLPLRLSGPELIRCLRVSRQTDRLHEAAVARPHWYLQGLGVDPARQGLGVGSALVRPLLASADQTGSDCYLDTTNPANLPFYERHGFSVVAHRPGGGSEPSVWGMRRPPAR